MFSLRNAGKKPGILLTAVFAAGMVPLTFLDLPIARAVYHYSDLYGRIFKIAGVVPTCLILLFDICNDHDGIDQIACGKQYP